MKCQVIFLELMKVVIEKSIVKLQLSFISQLEKFNLRAGFDKMNEITFSQGFVILMFHIFNIQHYLLTYYSVFIYLFCI